MKKQLPGWFIALSVFFLCLQLLIVNLGTGDFNLLGHLKGNDFVYFHNGGVRVLAGDVYQGNTFNQHIQSDYPVRGGVRNFRPVHPPVMYYLYAPVAGLPILTALNIMSALFVLVYIAAILLILKTLPELKENAVFFLIVACGLPFISNAIQSGHPSALWILFFAGAFYLWKQGKFFLAGMVLSLFIIKPNFYLLFGAALVLCLEWKAVAGMAAGAVFIIFITGVWDGFFLWRDYISVTLTYPDFLQNDGYFKRQYSVKTFLQYIWSDGGPGKILGIVGLVLGALALFLPAIYKFRSRTAFNPNRYFFVTGFAIVLANPHIFDYDLVLLVLPVALLLLKMLENRIALFQQALFLSAGVALLAGYHFISSYTHVQIVVPVMIWMAFMATFDLPPSEAVIAGLIKSLPARWGRGRKSAP